MANNPYVNKVQFGNQTVIDLTSDTIVANKLLSSKTAHDASGNQIVGTYDFASATAANAVASDVTEGKTGWANGVQIIGTKISIPTWADGTDAEIAEALTRHYNDEIDLTDYWTVGDERVVHLSAMGAMPGYNAQPEQDVTLVLVNSGGRTLTTPINNHTECAFVVGQKDCLTVAWPFNYAWPNNGWGDSDIRDMLNYESSVGYLGALPATLRGIFKSYAIPYCADYSTSVIQLDNRIVGLPARKEIFGVDDSSDKASSSYNLLSYYQDSNNRIKKVQGTAYRYWTNSKYYSTNTTNKIYAVSKTGTQTSLTSNNTYGIAPQMVI